jgi:PAS domain S-box-containing protein
MSQRLKQTSNVRKYALLAVVAWTLVIGIFFILSFLRTRKTAVASARVAAEAQIAKDILYRCWNAQQSGVYVPVTESIQPNPYLTQVPERDIHTSSGLTLTYVNPAYMTRLVHEIGLETKGIRGHITSLNPLRPENAPDAWEKRALERFNQGERAVSSLEVSEGQSYLRFMQPLMVEESCLKCHGQQGNVRGGISVSVPMDPYLAISRREIVARGIGHLVCWFLGLAGIGIAMSRIDRANRRILQQQGVLMEKEARQRAMISNITDVITILDRDGITRYKSPNMEKWFGWKPEELVGSVNWENIHPDDRLLVQARFTALLDNPGATATSECRYRRKDGQYRWIECTATNLLQDSAIEGILLTYHDITDRVGINEALRESEAQYRTFLNETLDGILRLDLKTPIPVHLDIKEQVDLLYTHTTITECNPAFARMYGFDDPTDLIGKRLVKLPGKPEEELSRQRIRTFVQSNYRLEKEEVTEIGTDGLPRYFYNNTIGIVKEGFLVHVWKTQVDITARKRVEQALRESEQKYRLLFEMESDALFLIDNETGNILDVNAAAVSLYGYSREELLRMRNVDLSAEPTATRRATLKGPTYIPVRYHHKKDGSIFPVEITATMLTQNGRPMHIPAIRDITERKQAEEEREKLQNQLLQSQKMESVGRLAGGVAHDFNNMLGVILGHAEMALDRLDPPARLQNCLLEIRKAAERSANLTRQLLAFARKQTIAPRLLDLNRTVDGMLQMLQRLIGEGIELAWKPDPAGCQVKVDPTQVDQILVNLCINARDAINGEGKITIATERVVLEQADCVGHEGFVPGQFASLTVSDNGAGMAPETLPHIFEPFFTTKEIGTGLGLATVYGIVKQNQGFIEVTSQLDRGTTFRIYLPWQEGRIETPEPPPAPKPVQPGRETVLLVEDEPAILDMTTTLLEYLGYRVLPTSKPDEAIQIAHQHLGKIHLLMTDVVMPEMNGQNLARHLLALDPNLKCLFMSGYTDDVIAHHGFLNEGVHFIQKPFSKDELATQLREALDARRDDRN